MGFIDDAKNKAEELVGKGKEKAGEATDNQELKHEGQADQLSSKVKQGVENVKDGVNDLLNDKK
ncbi:CsbD family protein [uncultured Gulosibacter sp.]|uniref:CsbD family protein n=1 Tax=uncultured Gulosibacter sp. TaxID=1339167 RepID=UPI002889E433|nr:CsbD family protein [uncultured Gulosibacter sp.]